VVAVYVVVLGVTWIVVGFVQSLIGRAPPLTPCIVGVTACFAYFISLL
jgi:hypothetical protein